MIQFDEHIFQFGLKPPTSWRMWKMRFLCKICGAIKLPKRSENPSVCWECMIRFMDFCGFLMVATARGCMIAFKLAGLTWFDRFDSVWHRFFSQALAEALKVKNIDLSWNRIGNEGAEACLHFVALHSDMSRWILAEKNLGGGFKYFFIFTTIFFLFSPLAQ